MKRIRASWPCLLNSLVIGFLTPSLVIFFLEVGRGGPSTSTDVEDILTRQFASGHNLFLP
jgi:hypothetical protein